MDSSGRGVPVTTPEEWRRPAECSARAAGSLFEAIFGHLTDGVYLVSPSNDLAYVNPLIEAEFGPVQNRKCHDYLIGRSSICENCQGLSGFDHDQIDRWWQTPKTEKICNVSYMVLKGPSGDLWRLGVLRYVQPENEGVSRPVNNSERERLIDAFSSKLLGILESERKRISRELHDEMGQALTVLKLRMRVIEKELTAEQNHVQKECRDARAHIEKVIEEVHRLCQDLSPAMLDDLGLMAALRSIVDDFKRHHGIPLSFETDDIDHIFPRGSEINLYRIIQEALTNIARHAEAGRVRIAINKSNNRCHFLISDDGKGFNVERIMNGNGRPPGMGLLTMRERVRVLKGDLTIQSREAEGTTIAFTIPCRAGVQ
jgi:signal transduction histidine kinase